ncbi:MAG: hypothetical protein V7K70_00065, partial [Nostoc sp.]
NLLTDWISYVRTGYRDSLINESHHLTESSAFNVSNLLTDWISYVRADYRDSLINESHRVSTFFFSRCLITNC